MLERCPKCNSVVQVVNTRIVGGSRIRYIGCRGCGYRPPHNKRIVPLIYAPARVATSSTTQYLTGVQLR